MGRRSHRPGTRSLKTISVETTFLDGLRPRVKGFAEALLTSSIVWPGSGPRIGIDSDHMIVQSGRVL